MWGVSAGLSPPTVRVYTWEPPALSLGYFQPLAEVNLAACRVAGVDVVRRPTGGRAILHEQELTYSLVAPESSPSVAGGVLESYARISQALIAGLARLGIDARFAPPAGRLAESPSAACFEVPSSYEVLVAGRKLIGSAQRRQPGVVLQHGAIPLQFNPDRLVGLLNLPSPAAATALTRRLAERTIDLATALNREIRTPADLADLWQQLAGALSVALAETFDLILTPGTLTPQEEQWVAVLRREKYARLAWTERREAFSGRENRQLPEAILGRMR